MTPKPPPSPADRLRELHAKTTPGRWHWWTSNSWKRLRSEPRGGITTNVLEPYTVWHDRHPDCLVNDADMEFITAAHNDLPALLSDHARLVEENGRLTDLLRRALPSVEADAQMMDAMDRHAPLPVEDMPSVTVAANTLDALVAEIRAALSPSQKEGAND